jgi:thioredoxin-like negative regulator of GroEL
MALDPGLSKEVNAATFATEVLDASFRTPVIAYFWSPSSDPCRNLGALFDEAVGAARGIARLAKFNADENPEFARQFGISSVPAVLAFIENRAVELRFGELSQHDV